VRSRAVAVVATRYRVLVHRPRHAVRRTRPSRARRILIRLPALAALALAASLIAVFTAPATSSRPNLLAGRVSSPPPTNVVAAVRNDAAPAPTEEPPALVAPEATTEPDEDPGRVDVRDFANLNLVSIPSSELTRTLAALRSKAAIPGVSATIIWPDGTAWSATSGFADLYGKVRLTRSTAFAVASVTKTFVAALIVQLAQEARLGLDDPVVNWLPAAGVDPRVTVRQLLDHTSGVYDFFSNSAIDGPLRSKPAATWTPERALSYVKKPYFEPGTGWHYSNTGYVLLGQVAEAVTGNSWASEIRARFLDPLRLTSAYVQGFEQTRSTLSRGYRFTSTSRAAKAIDLTGQTGVAPFRAVVSAAGAAGAVAASSWDLARWTRALYGGSLLTPPALGAMLDVAATAKYRYAVPYGMGVQQYVMDGRTAYGHGGRLMGARAAIRYLPAEGVTIAVVINTDRGDPGAIAASLLKVALPPVIAPSPSPSGPAPSTSPIVPAPSFGASASP
jgi:D-alanyl-D-alanine carboxypeptidase